MWPEDPESPIYRARAAHCGEPSTTSRRRSARDEDARVAPAIIGGGGAPILFDGTPLRAQRDTRAAHAGRGQAEPSALRLGGGALSELRSPTPSSGDRRRYPKHAKASSATSRTRRSTRTLPPTSRPRRPDSQPSGGRHALGVTRSRAGPVRSICNTIGSSHVLALWVRR